LIGNGTGTAADGTKVTSMVIVTGANVQPSAIPSDVDFMNKLNAGILPPVTAIPQAPTALPAPGQAPAAPKKTGTIYRVPAGQKNTNNGKPYIGRHKGSNPAATRKSKDGRDRTKAEVIDHYDPDNVQEGREKEQKAIDDHGGIDNLDNKRNEIKKDPKKDNGNNGSS